MNDMKIQIRLLSAFIALFFATNLLAQNHDFSNCSAAFLDKKMIVNEYSPDGKCIVESDAAGMLTLHPVTLESGKEPIPGEKIAFKVAIRGGESRTLMMYSEKTYREIDIQKILKECQKGDHIVVITVEREWAVPHSEILVR